MERELLEDLLAQGLSLEEIGARCNRHASTVGYWLKSYGLEAVHSAKHAARGGLPRDQLESLVERGSSHRAIANELGVSVSTIRHWLKHHGLKTERTRRREDGVGAVLGDADAPLRECARRGVTEFILEARGSMRCLRCRAEGVARHRRRLKERLVAEAGGRCGLCGYERTMRALQFHHLDPNSKEFGFAERGVTRSLAKCRAEARKCILLCANCHAEVEAGIVDLPRYS
jgi:transposase